MGKTIGLMVQWFNGLMVYWFNGFTGFHTGKPIGFNGLKGCNVSMVYWFDCFLL